MSENTSPFSSNSDAEFIGWQEVSFGENLALFNITAPGHPSFGSTVTEESLRTMNLKVPKISNP